MSEKYVHIVLAKHPNCDIPYTFMAPDDRQLHVGDYILCDTKRGPNQMAQCITPSFVIMETQLERFYNIKASNLKRVTAELKPHVFVYRQEVQYGEDGQQDEREQV